LRLLRDAARCAAEKFDQVLDGLKVREQKQILPPRFVVEEVLKEMTEFIGQTCFGKYSGDFIQDPRCQDRQVKRDDAPIFKRVWNRQ